MENNNIQQLFLDNFGYLPIEIKQLPQAGSDRIYYKITGKDNFSCIATYGKDTKENESFINITNHFQAKNIKTPKVFCVSQNKEIYLQENLGNTALYDIIKQEGISNNVIDLLKKTIKELAFLQIKGAENFDFTNCFPIQEFDKYSMFWDLNSFKYYFVRPARIQFNEPNLNKDFNTLCDYLATEKNTFFMFRDCQSRNIMIKNNEPFFIDYQGGRKGALQYDIASLLWQANAKIPHQIKEKLFDEYTQNVSSFIAINTIDFKQKYNGFVLIRLLQVLGAYGFRGIFERRPHFLESIPPALENIRWFLENIQLDIELPELYKILHQLVAKNPFEIQKIDGSTKPLKISINSFSYKRAIPKDTTQNGGGFVFDCRGLHNPGRYEPYKKLTGKDKPVIDFLETQSKIKEYLESVFKIIDINIEDYLKRDFENLQINFGCTGGQHRSVYCAEATKKYIKNKYNIDAEIHHIERELQGQFI